MRWLRSMSKSLNIDMRDAFFDSVYEMGSRNKNIMFLSVDHGAFGLEKFQKDLPEQFINMGIAEQNLIGVASGLALSGKIVYCYGITPFVSLRVLEQVSLDLASMNLNVNIVSVGAGFTYSTDGPSHHGLQDLPAILSTPNLQVLNSSDPIATKAFGIMAVKEKGAKYIRIEKGILPILERINHKNFSVGTSKIKHGNDVTIVSTGAIIHEAFEAIKKLEQTLSVNIGLIDVYKIKPFPKKAFLDLISNSKKIVTIEEGYIQGGLGSLVASIIAENRINIPFLRLGVEDKFCFDYGSREYLRDLYGLSSNKINNSIQLWLKQN